MAGCLTCELIERRDAGQAPGWDCILRTTRWDVAHAFSVAVEGWVVLVVRRHITALADLTDAEAAELNEIARYPGGEECPGVEAMRRYGAVSGPCLEAAAGRFLSQALLTGVAWGDDDGPWHLLVVASYPDAGAFWSLLADPDYRRAFAHRRAAVARQRVLVGASL